MRQLGPFPKWGVPGKLLLLITFSLLVLTLVLVAGPSTAAASSSDGNVTAYRASNLTVKDIATVEEAIADNRLKSTGKVAVGDILVVVIESERLADSMTTSNGSSTERFFAAIAGEAEFRIVQTNPSAQANRKVAPIGPENVTVYRNGTISYILIKTGDIDFRYRKVHRSTRIHGGEQFAIEFGYDLDSLDSRSAFHTTGPVVEFYPSKAEFSTASARVWYEPLPPEWIQRTVEVNLQPEKSLIVRATLDNNRTITVSVEPRNVPEWVDVWLNLTGVTQRTAYRLELLFDGEVVDAYRGTIRVPHARISDATLTQVGNRTVVNTTVLFSHGGTLEVLNDECDIIGREFIEPSTSQQVTVELWKDGREVRADPEDGYSLLLRSQREDGATKALYANAEAESRLDFNRTCQAPTAPAPPASTEPGPVTPTPQTKTVPPAWPSSRLQLDTTEIGTSVARGPNGQTVTPGQPGFTLVTGIVVLVLGGRLAVRHRC